MRTMVQMERTQSTAGVPPATSAWSKRKGWILLGAIVTFVALGLATYLQATRPKRKDVETLPPVATWALWQDLRKGPNRHLYPTEKEYIDALHINRCWLYVTVTLTGVGSLLMTIFYLELGRRTAKRIKGASSLKPRSGANKRLHPSRLRWRRHSAGMRSVADKGV